MHLFLRIKKYLFLLSLVFSLGLAFHIVGIYMYDGSETIPERGGSMSIGMIAKSPSVAPTEFSLDTNNDFILSFLYRGLLKHNPLSRTMEGDLANCDLGKSLTQIKCFFKTWATWSDGSRITLEDALSTYSLFAETDTNKSLRNGLANFAITREGDAIVFRTNTPSTESLPLFTLPILKKSVVEAIRNNTATTAAVTSGGYTLTKRDINATIGNESITLASTQESGNPTEYNRIVFKIFPDEDSLTIGKDNLNFIYPGQYKSENFWARFKEGKLLTPNFVSAFLNTTTLSPEKRSLIINLLSKRGNWEKDFESVKNPFFTQTSIIPTFSGSLNSEADIFQALERVGYTPKKILAQSPDKPVAPPASLTPPPSSTTGSIINTGATTGVPDMRPATPSTVSPPPPTLKYIRTPSFLVRSTVVGKSEILITGSVPTGTTAVFINGYRLKGYEIGSGTFSYRARSDLRNFRSGQNIYKLSVEKAWTITTLETTEIWNMDSTLNAQELEKSWVPKISPTATPVIVTPSAPTASPVVPSGMSSPGSPTISGATITSSGVQAPTTPKPISSNVNKTPETKNPIVSPRLWVDLYTADGKRAVIRIRVLNPLEEVRSAATEAARILKEIGFEVQLEETDPSIESLKEATKVANKTYDLLITWVNLGYLGTHLSPYLHSGQVQDGFNFSLLRNWTLDMLLEELRSRSLSSDELALNIGKINTLLKSEGVLFMIGANSYSYFADTIIYNLKIPEFLSSTNEVVSAIRTSYLRNQHIVNLSTKSLQGFITWFSEQLRGVSPEVSSVQDSWKKK